MNAKKYRNTLNTTFVFFKRDLKERYARSILGPLWIILYPLILMGVVTTIFSVVFSTQVQEFPYAVFALIGFVHWLFFSQSISHLTRSFVSQKELIKNHSFSLIAIPLSVLLSRMVDYLVGLLLISILLITTHQLSALTLVLVLALVFFQALFQLGLGIMLVVFNSFYQDVQYLVEIGLQILFYLTPIIYSFSLVPAHLQKFMNWNPLVLFFRNYHSLFISGDFNWEWGLISMGLSLLSLGVGLKIYQRFRYQVPELL